jgi:hypothetical protein
MTDTFNTGGEINVIDGVAFGYGISWAFRQACAAGNAFFGNFHCHDSIAPMNIIYNAVCKV